MAKLSASWGPTVQRSSGILTSNGRRSRQLCRECSQVVGILPSIISSGVLSCWLHRVVAAAITNNAHN